MGLVLSGGRDDEFVIDHAGERLTIRIVRTRPGSVRLDFKSPRSFNIVRKIVLDRMEAPSDGSAGDGA